MNFLTNTYFYTKVIPLERQTRKVFNDPKLDLKFKKKGVVIIDLLSKENVSELRRIYSLVESSRQQQGIVITADHGSDDEKIFVFRQVNKIIEAALNSYLHDYHAFFINYMVKNPLQEKHTKFPYHQDYSYVDEEFFRGVNVWIPLQKSDAENGSLSYIPYSHRIFKRDRGRGFNGGFDRMHILFKYILSKTPSLNEGQAVIFDTALIHFSGSNNTKHPRLAVSCISKPKEARLIQFEKLGDKMVKYSIDYELFQTQSPTQPISSPPFHNINTDIVSQ